jgi:Concanavalin A-like lectin/glucanases superfamily/Polysaccharide lyase
MIAIQTQKNLRTYGVLLGLVVAFLLCIPHGFCEVRPDASSDTFINLDFESGYIHEDGGDYYYNVDGIDHWLAIEGTGYLGETVTTYQYEGNASMMFPVDGAEGGRARSELAIIYNQDFNETYYMSFSMLVPDTAPIPQYGTIFWQGHQYAPEGLSPPLSFNMDPMGNYTFVRNNYEVDDCIVLREYLPRGSWVRFFVEYEYGKNNDGHVVVWQDGVKKLSFDGTTAFATTGEYPWQKVGIYKGNDEVDYENYFDNVRWGIDDEDVWYGSETPEDTISPALIGHWRFDGLDGDIERDVSGGCSYVGNVVNATQVVDGIGGAMAFDGTGDWVSVPDSPIWDNGDSITVFCRFKTSVNQSDVGLVAHDTNYKYMLYLDGLSGDFKFYVRTASGVLYAEVCNANGYFADDEWHHVVGVYDRYAGDGNRLKLYVDCDTTTPGTATGYDESITAGTTDIQIGRWYQAADSFVGQMDDVRIYRTVLDGDEIQAIYDE